MKILYLDLSPWVVKEDYSVNPKSYGGGRVFASLLKEINNQFYILADSECFRNVTLNENKANCLNLTEDIKSRIRAGEKLLDIWQGFADFDLIITPHPFLYLNTEGIKAKQCAWCLGYKEFIHPSHTDILIYNNYQAEQPSNAKKHLFTLGIEMPTYPIFSEKERMIFQCSRHCPEFNSIQVADFAVKNKIRCLLAGKIIGDYPLLDHVDGNYVQWLGEISEADKINYTRRARLCTFLHSWETPMSLGALSSLSLGTPIVASRIGFWPSLIQQDVNGFWAHNESELEAAWNQSKYINPKDCWRSVALKYNSFNMIDSLQKVFYTIVNG